jgi:hypothetical protein
MNRASAEVKRKLQQDSSHLLGDPALQGRRRAVVDPGLGGLFSRVHGEQAHVCVIGVKT